jgi:DNA-binding response OmpR family regulator
MSLHSYDSEKNNSQERAHRTILLVEDEPFVREATCSILQRAGFRVLSAEDAQEAMEAFEANGRDVDLLMTDIVLPGKNGDELGEELRERSPEMVLLLTSGYGEAFREAESAGTRTYFLAKPYSRRALIDKIHAVLSNTKPRTVQAG